MERMGRGRRDRAVAFGCQFLGERFEGLVFGYVVDALGRVPEKVTHQSRCIAPAHERSAVARIHHDRQTRALHGAGRAARRDDQLPLAASEFAEEGHRKGEHGIDTRIDLPPTAVGIGESEVLHGARIGVDENLLAVIERRKDHDLRRLGPADRGIGLRIVRHRARRRPFEQIERRRGNRLPVYFEADRRLRIPFLCDDFEQIVHREYGRTVDDRTHQRIAADFDNGRIVCRRFADSDRIVVSRQRNGGC